ncbi:hypothetical protein [Amycolatopsis decaplanina]|uniref:Uncharacterized protein n=1 Tax=Amycolatopsis decaplanina DSM 44594 TaxID=1284240 RepID=M2ZC29_9PSEU|nr:hypothetical protein [Amycolatopsis decaplanina]EME58463.1 hypothetical protein H074_17828 [Amycolatopsis decaplanina DSM 44594]
MDELENRLRGITLAEPPLGFDPDEVAGTAAKKVRNRRAAASTGAATLAVIAAAVVFVVPGEGPAPLAPAASRQAPPTPKDDLQHLKDVVPQVITGAKNIAVGDFSGYGDLKTAEVRYTDAEGRPRGINLTIAGPVSTKDAYPREGRCKPETVADGIGPDGKPMRCVELPQPGGSFAVISETAPKSVDEWEGDIIVGQGFSTGKVATRNAIAFPSGGGSVNIFDLGTLDDGPRGGPSLSDQQLLALILDPAFVPR